MIPQPSEQPALGLNRRMIRALYPTIDWDEYDREVVAEAAGPDPVASPAGPCIFDGCVSRDRHWHGGFPGGYSDPADPDGPPIPFTTEPEPGVRDYNGAVLDPVATPAPLDVERLARAIEFVGWRNPRLRANRHEVLMIAAEYERLEGQPVGEEGS